MQCNNSKQAYTRIHSLSLCRRISSVTNCQRAPHVPVSAIASYEIYYWTHPSVRPSVRGLQQGCRIDYKHLDVWVGRSSVNRASERARVQATLMLTGRSSDSSFSSSLSLDVTRHCRASSACAAAHRNTSNTDVNFSFIAPPPTLLCHVCI